MNDFDDRICRVAPISDRQLNKMYVSGLLRNIQSVLAGLYGDLFPVGKTIRSRGEASYDLYVQLFRHSNLRKICKQLLFDSAKNDKQGFCSFHDLAIAHCLLCVLQYAQSGKHGRHSDVFTSSQALGRVVEPLRKLTLEIFSDCSISEFRTLDSDSLAKRYRSNYQGLLRAINEALTVIEKSKVRLFDPDILNIPEMVAALALIRSSGLDDAPFDDFLDLNRRVKP